MQDQFEHLTPDEAFEARHRLARADSRRQHAPLLHNDSHNGSGCGCLSVLLLALWTLFLAWLVFNAQT